MKKYLPSLALAVFSSLALLPSQAMAAGDKAMNVSCTVDAGKGAVAISMKSNPSGSYSDGITETGSTKIWVMVGSSEDESALYLVNKGTGSSSETPLRFDLSGNFISAVLPYDVVNGKSPTAKANEWIKISCSKQP